MTVQDVIDAVRSRLGDKREDRWKSDTLRLYISLCQSDICIETNWYRKSYILPLYEGQLLYNLPLDCVRVERMEYDEKFFPIETRNSIDSGKAQFPCALKDNLPYGQVEIRLECSDTPLSNELENTYGVVTESDLCTLEDKYGIVTSVNDEVNPNPEDKDVVGYVRIYYSAVPELLETDDETLLFPDMWLLAFIHFVGGMALQDDNDANNIQRGELEGQKYIRVLQQLLKASAKDFTTNVKSKLVTERRGI